MFPRDVRGGATKSLDLSKEFGSSDYPLLNFWTLRWGILFVYLIIVLIKERFRIGTLVPVLAEKCSFFKEK